jgi:hypothetical protein
MADYLSGKISKMSISEIVKLIDRGEADNIVDQKKDKSKSKSKKGSKSKDNKKKKDKHKHKHKKSKKDKKKRLEKK